MRKGLIACLGAALLVILSEGCARSSLDTTRVEMAFEMVGDTNRVVVEQACSWVREGRYGEALDAFRGLRERHRLTPVQEMALHELIVRLERRVPRTAGNASPGR